MFADMELNRTSPPRPQSHLKSENVQEIGLAECFRFIIYLIFFRFLFLLNIETILRGAAQWKKLLFLFFSFSFLPTHAANPQTDSFVDGLEMRLSFLQIAALSNTKKKKKVIGRRQNCAEVRVSVCACVCVLIGVTAFRTRNMMNPSRRLCFR